MQSIKRTTSLILFSFFIYGTYGKTKALSINPNDSNKTKHYKLIEFYTWGMPDFGYPSRYEKCEDSLQHQYGFYYWRKAGCVVSGNDVRKWKRHNKRCDKQMSKRFGPNWREQYEKELNECSNG